MSALRSKYGLNETAVLVLKDGNDEPMLGEDGQPWTITVYAPGTKQHNRARARETNVSVDRFQAKGKAKISGDELQADRVAYALLVTKEVSANLAAEFPGLQGDDLHKAIFTDKDIGFLALELVNEKQRKTENFTKGSTGP